MFKASSILLRGAPLLLALLPTEVNQESHSGLESLAECTSLISEKFVAHEKHLAGKAKVQEPSRPYTFVNQGHGQIKTILMGIQWKSNGDFYELQINFLKEFCSRNPNAKVILLYSPSCELNEIQQHLKEIKVLNNVELIKVDRSSSYVWVQDPVIFLKDLKKKDITALTNPYSNFAEPLLKSKIISDIIVPENKSVCIDGGDFRVLEGPNGPVLVTGLYRQLTGRSMSPKDIVLLINDHINEFKTYGFLPHNILFRGGNSEGITFHHAFKKMSQKELSSLHPHILTMRSQEIPMDTRIGCHTDLTIFETGIRDKRGKPILMVSKPLILYDDHFQELTARKEKEEIKQFKEWQGWWRKIYETECKQYINMGFAIRPLPFGETDKNYISIVNYTNVVANTALNGKREIYLPIQGNNHPFDLKAIKAYKEVYGSSAEIIQIKGSQQMSPQHGLLNCLVNVIERE